MTRKLFVVLAITVTALSGAAIAEARTKTRITDTSVNPNDEGGNRISGVVVSGRESCHNNRKVFLFKKKGRVAQRAPRHQDRLRPGHAERRRLPIPDRLRGQREVLRLRQEVQEAAAAPTARS